MLAVSDAFPRPHRWVTFDTIDARSKLAGQQVCWGHYPTTRNLPNLARNFRQAIPVMRSARPEVVMSTGAGLAVPYFWLAHRFGARAVYMEVVDRIDSRTMTGRLVYPVADDFLVQWPEQQELYAGAKLIGPVI